MTLFQPSAALESNNQRSSVAPLLIANALPLIGVVFFGWDAFAVVFVYCSENVVIGLLNVAKIICCSPDPDEVEFAMRERLATTTGATPDRREEAVAIRKQLTEMVAGNPLVKHGIKLFLVPFFIVHYGLFCFVHGVFVSVLLGNNGAIFRGGNANPFDAIVTALGDPLLLFSIAAIALGHIWSFFVNYLWGGEYRRTLPMQLLVQPYGRIVVLHIAILAGGFAAVLFGSPVWMLVPLVIGKTLLDLKLHEWSHSPANG